jgi:hypothetical protein
MSAVYRVSTLVKNIEDVLLDLPHALIHLAKLLKAVGLDPVSHPNDYEDFLRSCGADPLWIQKVNKEFV